MSDVSTSMEAVTAALQAVETELAALAQAVLQPGSAVDDPARQQAVSRQLLVLAEQCARLKLAVTHHTDVPPADEVHWPRLKILQSQEEERMQLARLLEDSVGQLLANSVFELAAYRHILANNAPTGSAVSALDSDLSTLQTEIEQGLTNFRQMMTELDPTAILSNFGLGGGVRRYLEQLEAQTGLKTRLQVKTNFGRLPTLLEVAIFRVIQEALNNVRTHAAATQVDVAFDEQNGQLLFSIVDNGRGLSADSFDGLRKNFGLARMLDYADLLKGELKLLSEPERGTQVLLKVPYPVL